MCLIFCSFECLCTLHSKAVNKINNKYWWNGIVWHDHFVIFFFVVGKTKQDWTICNTFTIIMVISVLYSRRGEGATEVKPSLPVCPKSLHKTWTPSRSIVLLYHHNWFILFGDKLLPSSIIVTTIMTQFKTMTAYFGSQHMVAHYLKVLSLDG